MRLVGTIAAVFSEFVARRSRPTRRLGCKCAAQAAARLHGGTGCRSARSGHWAFASEAAGGFNRGSAPNSTKRLQPITFGERAAGCTASAPSRELSAEGCLLAVICKPKARRHAVEDRVTKGSRRLRRRSRTAGLGGQPQPLSARPANRTSEGRGEPQGNGRQTTGRRRAIDGPQTIGAAAGGCAPRPKPSGAGNRVAASHAQTASPRRVQRIGGTRFPARGVGRYRGSRKGRGAGI